MEERMVKQLLTSRKMQKKKKKRKKRRRNEGSVRDLWDDIKCTNIRIIGVRIREEWL